MANVRVTALMPGDGTLVAALWRDLWILHESWKGYPASRDPAVYAELAERLETWAQRRRADPLLGQHVHLVARDANGTALGQVEGWIERHGLVAPPTCEIRSLIVAPSARGAGVGRLLLTELEELARRLARGPTFVVAEVLVPNPALAFYARLGYRPISLTMMLPTRAPSCELRARDATAADAMAVARLEMERRLVARGRGDLRLDRPSSVDASFTHTVAQHLSAAAGSELHYSEGPHAAHASLTVATLEAPFEPVVRAALGRLALAHGSHTAIVPLAALAQQRARRRGAPRIEIAELSVDPADSVNRALEREGALAFSRIVGRLLP